MKKFYRKGQPTLARGWLIAPITALMTTLLLGVAPLTRGQAPTLTTRNPTRNAWSASPSFGVNEGFSQSLNPSLATLGALHLFGNQSGRRAGTAFVSNTHLVLTLASPLRAGEQVQVTTTTAVQSTGGFNLAQGQGYSYTAATGGTGQGYFSPPTQIDLGIGGHTGGTYVGDLDGDGDPDALVGEFAAGTVGVYSNLGGGMIRVGTVPLVPGVWDVRGGDLDGDGDPDFVSLNYSTNQVSVRFNNGAGVFGGGYDFASAWANVSFLELADLDADGDLDLVTWNVDTGLGSRALIHLNTGTGTFAAATFVPLADHPRNGLLGDVDNDGDVDLCTVVDNAQSLTTGLVLVHRNNSAASFTASTSATVGPYPTAAALADLDLDGDLDLITANLAAANSLSYRYNNGSGIFSGSFNQAMGNPSYTVAVGDVDADGRPDVVTSNAGETQVWLNSVGPTFTLLRRGFQDNASGNVSGLDRLTLADLDGDDDLDVVGRGPTDLILRYNVPTVAYTRGLPGWPLFKGLRTDTLRAQFNQTMAGTFGSLSSLKVFSAQAGGRLAPSALTANRNKLLFRPTNPFRAGEVISATVTTAAQSVLGAALPQGRTWQFTAAATGGFASFNPRPDAGVGANCDGVEVADFNNDGFLDVVTANLSGSVTIRNGTSGGLFSPTLQTLSVPSARRVAVGDIDNDGDLDIAASTWSGSGVYILKNNGAGVFTTTTTSVGVSPYGIALADLNADGNLDLLTANYSSGSVSVRFGNGAGLFSGGTDYATGAGCQGVAVGDFNFDGSLDFATANYSALTCSCRFNNGAGVFSGGQDMPTSGQPWNVSVADLDQNGLLDIQIAGNGVELAQNVGGGFFSGFVNSVDAGTGFFDVATADVDGDGDPDLLATRNFPSGVIVRLNNGSGSFSGTTVVPVGQNMLSLAVADLDGDFDLDFVAADANNALVNVRLNELPPFVITARAPARHALAAPLTANVDVTFSQPVLNAPLSANSVKVFSMQAGGKKSSGIGVLGNVISVNPNTDFRPGEVVNVTATSAATNAPATQNLILGQVHQFTAAATAGPGLLNGPTPVAVGQNPLYVALADVDGDGDLDLLTANASNLSNSVSIRLNNGTGTAFTAGPAVALSGVPYQVIAADIDADGDLDLLTSINSSNVVDIRLNNGAGVFTAAPPLVVGAAPLALAAADVDADGDLDLLCTLASATVNVLLNNGAGTFTSAGTSFAGGNPTGIAVGDLNNDGDLDYVTATNGGSSVEIGANNGAGGFTTTTYNLTIQPYGVTLADLNADGFLDLVASNSGAGTNVAMAFNDGLGNFLGQILVPMGTLPAGVALGDVDGDGDLDLLTANAVAGTVSLRANNGAGTFLGINTLPIGTGPNGLALGDLDGDGDLDLVCANSGAAQLAVRLNEYPDLVVSAPQSVIGGPYHNITVTGTGLASISGPTTATNAVLVQPGGIWRDNCNLLIGTASFTLQAGAAMEICHQQGISLSGPTGAIQVTGLRSYSTGADYNYNTVLAQVTGNGLTGARDLTVTTTPSLTLSAAASVSRLLTLPTGGGNFALGGNALTLLSSTAGTAMVVNAGTGVVTGNTAVVQRYLTPGTAPALGYRHLSAPVSGSTVNDLAVAFAGGYTPYVNPAYNPLPTPALPLALFPNIFGFDESRGGPSDPNFVDGWFSPLTLADPLVPGRGYSVLMNPLTPDFVGTLGTGNVPMVSLSTTGAFLGNTQKTGWHLLGNPYPAPLGWDLAGPGPAPGQIPTGMSSSISVFKSTGGSNGIYLTRAGGIGSLTNGEVAMGQGFFARVTGGTPITFTFTNGLRLTSYTNPPHYRPAPETRPVLGLALRPAGNPTAEAAEAFVYVQPGATPALDDRFDGSVPGHNVGVATLVSLTATGDELAINGLPESTLTTPTTIELLADLPAPGTYALSVGQWDNLPAGAVALLDRLTGTSYDLAATSVVTFAVRQPGLLRGRLALRFGQRVTGLTTLATPETLQLWPNPASGEAHVRVPARVTSIEVLDATGRLVRTAPTNAGAVTLPLRGLPAGVYVVKAGAQTARLVVE